MNTTVIDDFVLATLLQPRLKNGLKADSILKADVKRLLASVAASVPPQKQVGESLVRLEAASCVSRSGVNLELTDAGRRRALDFLGVSNIPANTKWETLLKGYFVARALQIAGKVSTQRLTSLAKIDGLCFEIIRQFLELAVPPVPGKRELSNALGWALLSRGADPELVRRAHQNNPTFAVGPVLDVLCLHAAGLTTYRDGCGLRVLAAHTVGAQGTDAPEILRAVLTKLFDTSAAGSFSTVSSGGTSDAERSFVDRVLQAAHSIRNGRVNSRLVFVSHVWRVLHHTEPTISLDQFKAQLKDAYRARAVVLAKADMPQTLDPTDIMESRIVDRDKELVFVELEEDSTHD